MLLIRCSASVDVQLQEVRELEEHLLQLCAVPVTHPHCPPQHAWRAGSRAAGAVRRPPQHTRQRRVCGLRLRTGAAVTVQHMAGAFLQRHGVHMQSAYRHYDCQAEPPHTSVTHRRRTTIDYIFHSNHLRSIPSHPSSLIPSHPIPSHSRPVQLLAVPALDELGPGGIPNHTHGSDHLPLLAVLALA